MFGLQELFDKTIEKQFKPNVLGVRILESKLEKIGIILTDFQRDGFQNQFKNLEDGKIHFDLSDEQVENAGYSDKEEELKTKLIEVVDTLADSTEDFISNLDGTMDGLVLDIVESMAGAVKRTIIDRQEDMVEDYGAIYQGFSEEISLIWGEAINLLQGYIVISDEATQGYLKRHISTKEEDITLNVLMMLQARASQIAKEVLSLIRNGFADGAQARWRSLHELAVVAAFIKSHGDEVSSMYLDHEGIESYKAAVQYNEFYTRLGVEPISSTEMNSLKIDYDRLIDKYGRVFRYDYGWASNAISNPKPNFRDIERATEFDHIRPYYKAASHNVHANVKGVLHKLGLYPEENILLAGPSVIGLSDPAKLTVISLNQISTTLFTHKTNIDFLVASKVMLEFGRDVEDAFILVEEQLAEKNYA